jgi:hypothetical protein
MNGAITTFYKILFSLFCVFMSGEALHAQSTQYWYGTLNQNVTVKDSEYYKRLDAKAQERADRELEVMRKSNEYYVNGDYESCEHYARIALDFRYYEASAWCNIAASKVQTGEMQKARRAYSKGYKKMDPEMRRSVQSMYKEKFGKDIKRRRSFGRKLLNGSVVAVAVTGIAVGGFFYANDPR